MDAVKIDPPQKTQMHLYDCTVVGMHANLGFEIFIVICIHITKCWVGMLSLKSLESKLQ